MAVGDFEGKDARDSAPDNLPVAASAYVRGSSPRAMVFPQANGFPIVNPWRFPCDLAGVFTR